MDKELLDQKIKQLSDDKLKELLQLRTKGNHEIIELAEKEAIKRGISIEEIETKLRNNIGLKTKEKEGIDWMMALFSFPD